MSEGSSLRLLKPSTTKRMRDQLPDPRFRLALVDDDGEGGMYSLSKTPVRVPHICLRVPPPFVLSDNKGRPSTSTST